MQGRTYESIRKVTDNYWERHTYVLGKYHEKTGRDWESTQNVQGKKLKSKSKVSRKYILEKSKKKDMKVPQEYWKIVGKYQ